MYFFLEDSVSVLLYLSSYCLIKNQVRGEIMKKLFTMTIASALLSIATSATADWSFVPLGNSAPGYSGYSSVATAINDSGQVVGYYDVSFPGGGATHAFMTGPNGVGITNLHPYDWTSGNSSFAMGINKSGQVAGEAWTDDHFALPYAFITGPSGAGFADLGGLRWTC